MCKNILQNIHISRNAKLAELAQLKKKILAIGVRQVSIFKSKISIYYVIFKLRNFVAHTPLIRVYRVIHKSVKHFKN